MIRHFVSMFKKNFIINTLSMVLIYFGVYFLFLLLHYGTHFDAMNEEVILPEIREAIGERYIFELQPRAPMGRTPFAFSFREFGENVLTLEEFQNLYLAVKENSNIELLTFEQNATIRIGEYHFRSLLFGKEYFHYFIENLQLELGRMFTTDDFGIFYPNTVPVILGYDFMETNQLGDRFNASYNGVEFSFEIIGFLSSGQDSFEGFISLVPLDDRILMPFPLFLESMTEEFDHFLKSQYFSKIFWTPILTQNNMMVVDEVSNFFNFIFTPYDLDYLFVGVNSNLTLSSHNETRVLVTHQRVMIFSLFFASFFVMIFLLTIFNILKFSRSIKVYSILSLLGIKKTTLYGSLFFENLILYLTPTVFLIYIVFFTSRGVYWNQSIADNFLTGRIFARTWFQSRTFLARTIFEVHTASRFIPVYALLLFLLSNLYPMIRLARVYKKGR